MKHDQSQIDSDLRVNQGKYQFSFYPIGVNWKRSKVLEAEVVKVCYVASQPLFLAFSST